MQSMTREEKIQLYRGIVQTISLIVLILGMIWMIKNFNDRKIMGECIFVHENGYEEHTGLYGNCTWYDAKINEYYLPQDEANAHIWTLQNKDNVNPKTEDSS